MMVYILHAAPSKAMNIRAFMMMSVWMSEKAQVVTFYIQPSSPFHSRVSQAQQGKKAKLHWERAIWLQQDLDRYQNWGDIGQSSWFDSSANSYGISNQWSLNVQMEIRNMNTSCHISYSVTICSETQNILTMMTGDNSSVCKCSQLSGLQEYSRGFSEIHKKIW